MAPDLSASFNPDLIATNSDAASSALAEANTASAAAVKGVAASSKIAAQSAAWEAGITAAANLTANALIVGDDGAKGVKSWINAMGKNAIINGDFNIWQHGTSFAAPVDHGRLADMVEYRTSGVAVVTVTRETDVPTQAESGHKSNYSLKVDCTTIDASIDATDLYFLELKIEGYNFAPFTGKTATLSFWVKAVKTGIYCVSFRNSTADRSYVVEYTINDASTWEKKTITLTFSDSGGTWDYINGIGLHLDFVLAAGTNFHGVADTWNAANNLATSNQVNGVDNTLNDFWLAQVQFELGSVATDFEYRQFGDELAKCQRYYWKTFPYATAPVQAVGNVVGALAVYPAVGGANQYPGVPVSFPVAMRATPTITYYSPISANATWENGTDVADSGIAGTQGAGDRGFTATCTTLATDAVGEPLYIHAQASAEL